MSSPVAKDKAVGQKIEVQVVYNGLTKTLALEPHQNMTAVVQLAAHLFGITDAHRSPSTNR